MAMDTILATLACYLLALSFAVAQTELTSTIPTITTSGLNLTPSNSPDIATVISDSTDSTTPFTNMTPNNETFTNSTTATTESTSTSTSTSPLQTSQSTTITTPLTNTPSLTTLTAATQTTVGNISTSDTPVITTANSSHTVNTTSDSLDRTTQALQLNIPEKNMTIVFSVVLGVFAMALVAFMFHKCKEKIQYLHQPLHNTDDTDAFVPDDDTLVISGGLYDGLPIYDNIPTPSADQSQFRLEFLH